MENHPRHLHLPLNEHSHQHLHETYPQDHLHDRFNQDYLNSYDHIHPHHHPYHHPISTANDNPTHLKEKNPHAGHNSHYHPKDHHRSSHKSEKEERVERQIATKNTDIAVKGFLDYVDKNNDEQTLKHDYEKKVLDPLDPRAMQLDLVSRSSLHHFGDGYREADHTLGVIDLSGTDEFKRAISNV